jgi:hypothetical protein
LQAGLERIAASVRAFGAPDPVDRELGVSRGPTRVAMFEPAVCRLRIRIDPREQVAGAIR